MTGQDDWSEEDVSKASIAELAAGRLPIRAQQRLATINADHAFTSNLAVAEHHAIRSAGFRPVGQVLGSCVYHIGYRGMWNCGASFFGTNSVPVPAAGLEHSLLDARRRAIHRMVQEAAGLGGDGVVAVRLAIRPFPSGDLEFQAIGTAVRAEGSVRPPQPFTSHLSGQEFAKLIAAGWVPVALALAVAVLVRHDDLGTRWQASSWSNQEMTNPTALVHAVRDTARQRLAADVAAHGGTGTVVSRLDLDVRRRDCSRGGENNHDHVAESIAIGTAIVPFRRSHDPHPAPLQMLRLNR